MSMRTTIEFDEDAARALARLRQDTGMGVSEAVNHLVYTVVNGGGIMLHAERPVGPVAAAQKCATHVPLSVRARGGGCTAWSFMRRFDWRLSRRV